MAVLKTLLCKQAVLCFVAHFCDTIYCIIRGCRTYCATPKLALYGIDRQFSEQTIASGERDVLRSRERGRVWGGKRARVGRGREDGRWFVAARRCDTKRRHQWGAFGRVAVFCRPHNE